MKKQILLGCLVLMVAGGLSALGRDFSNALVDNEAIQTYRGHVGRWINRNDKAPATVISELDSSWDLVKQVNDNAADTYIFVPMSETKYNELLNQGFGRRIFEIDPRKLLWPVEDVHYTSRFGMRFGGMHPGLDIACPRNTVVVAANDGTVKSAGWYGGLGNALTLIHADGLETVYGHNTVVLVKAGEEVRRGQIVAYSGTTGRSTGPHVHFEVRYSEVALNPEDFLQYSIVNPDLVIRETSPNDTIVASSETPPSN